MTYFRKQKPYFTDLPTLQIQIITNKMATRDNLQFKRTLCVMCEQSDETVKHLFFHLQNSCIHVCDF